MSSASMPTRKLGRSGLDVSVVSIGAMRLPRQMEEAVALLRRAIDLGCNYIDTSRGYADSELKIAQALRDGYRAKVLLSTKCSPWIMEEDGYTASAECTRRKIDEQMKRLAVDRLDFYQVWNVNSRETYNQAVAKGGMVDGIRQAMKEGIVGHVAATAHAPEDVVMDMIDSGLFEAITVSYHLLGLSRRAVMERAHAANVGVVVMNPLGGGCLATPSPVLANLLPEARLPSAAVALKFVIDDTNVSTAISGISKISDIEQNVAAAKLPPLSAEQRNLLAGRMAELDKQGRTFCTQCGYCMPCPQGVDIKSIFMLSTRARIFQMNDWARLRYKNMRPETKPDRCADCGKCEEKCTNHVAIRQELIKAQELLG